MPSAGDRSASSVSALPLPGRRLFSRLTSQFGSKTRHVADYYITLDDEHKQHSPGDQVSGAVHLKLNKAIRITHLVVCLHGFAQVYKTPGVPPAEGYRATNAHVGTGRGNKGGEYFGNGFASLFEDEVILCGDGRLEEGQYQFNFHLEFPDQDLPSSISFERGTISYMITATLTRPTTINPITQCDQKVYLVETIDISQLIPPKPRTITLEPLTRRSRAKTQARKLVDSDRKTRKTDSSGNQASNERRESQTSSSPSLHAVGVNNVQSPAHSEISFDSLTGSQGRGSQQESNATSPRPSDAARNNCSRVSLPTKTITAEVESLAGGCLRGDQVPIRVHVDHTKHVKSLHGVIITLYRQARVDMHPAIPIGPTEKGKEGKYEDYYPKSVTGLGGLSLSGAGSSHTFRKDLSQTVVPLIIDPTSLTAEVTGKVQIPDDAFPTISTVPGKMITFRYYIEVVLDIQGKLSTQDRNLGNLGGFASTMAQGQVSNIERDRSSNNAYGAPIIDTAAVRRDKGVVACTFEIILGTKDSARKTKGKRRVEDVPAPTLPQQPLQPDPMTGLHPGVNGNGVYHDEQWYGPDQGYYDQQYYHPYNYPDQDAYYDENGYMSSSGIQYEPPPVPMPTVEDESQLSEKDRIKRAEARLLPSQPPDAEEQATAGAQAPSAPFLPEELLNGYPPHQPPIILVPPVALASSSRRPITPVPIDYASGIPLPVTPRYERTQGEVMTPAYSTPAYEQTDGQSLALTPQTTVTRTPTDDKRELERQRQRMEASTSAPPGDGEDSTEGISSRTTTHADAPSSAAPVPSAPVLTDEDEMYIHDSHADSLGSPELPRYER